MTRFLLVGHPVRVARRVTRVGNVYAVLTVRCRTYSTGGKVRTFDVQVVGWGRIGQSLLADIDCTSSPQRKIAVAGRIVSIARLTDRGRLPVIQLNADEWEWADLVAGRLGTGEMAEDYTIPTEELDDGSEFGETEIKW